jgi:hypothetical protein
MYLEGLGDNAGRHPLGRLCLVEGLNMNADVLQIKVIIGTVEVTIVPDPDPLGSVNFEFSRSRSGSVIFATNPDLDCSTLFQRNSDSKWPI